MIIRNKKNRGFTLVELMIVVAIVGVLAALAIYGVRRYIANAKSAEARNTIGQIAKDAVTAFQRETLGTTVIAAGTSTAVSNQLCGQSTAVPAAIGGVKGMKYQSQASDWNGDSTNGWVCLRFSMSDPQYYQYQYTRNAADFAAVANGDLDGDGTTSTFSLSGSVVNNEALVAPSIAEISPDE